MALPGAGGHPHTTTGLGPESTRLIAAREERIRSWTRRLWLLSTLLGLPSGVGMSTGIVATEPAAWVMLVSLGLMGGMLGLMYLDQSERLARRAWARRWRELSARDLDHPRFARARVRVLSELDEDVSEVILALCSQFEGSADQLAATSAALVTESPDRTPQHV